ncbi:unnamed protein product [Caenorhabditis sp. 36 PRJEB53466]|nr:unnamed protein product [Caenorhabditis sp. 36 PRJEB53466]
MQNGNAGRQLETQRVDLKFFDLDDIIALSESTSCTFVAEELSLDFFKEMMGISKPTVNSEGHCADTPLWLINSVKSPHFVHLSQSLSVNMQSVLNADARNVNLSRLEQHFYANGMQVCQLMRSQNPEAAFNLSKCLLSTLTQRLGDIISNAAHARRKADKFDSLEIQVFQEAKKCKEDIDAWLRQDNKPSSKKRKRRNS